MNSYIYMRVYGNMYALLIAYIYDYFMHMLECVIHDTDMQYPYIHGLKIMIQDIRMYTVLYILVVGK